MPKVSTALHQVALSILSAVLVVSCNNGMLASGGIGGTGVTAVSVGPITQFGSIFVNGVEYHVKNAQIIVNGTDVTAGTSGNGKQIAKQNLAIGQVVKVTGTVDSSGTSGSATQVTFNANANGPISGSIKTIDTNTKELTVVGQSVVIDQDTQFAGKLLSSGQAFSIDDVAADMRVEVSGLTNADGTLHATYIKLEEENAPIGQTEVNVTGAIQSLNSSTFKINSQLINYADVPPTSFEGIPNGSAGLADGQTVEVAGVIDASGVLQASEISLESGTGTLGSGDAQSADIVGFINNFTSAGAAFVVNSQSVQANAATVYVRGLAADLGSGVKVEVKGTLQNGLLTAASIIFKDDVVLEANVSSVDPSTSTLTLAGLPGITVDVNSLTQLGGDNFPAFSNLPGMYIKVRGHVDGNGTVTATELDLEQTTPSSDITLQGPVQQVSGSLVTILGTTIDTHIVSSFSIGDSNPTESQFLGSLATSDVVKASGTLNNSSIAWDEMELEQ